MRMSLVPQSHSLGGKLCHRYPNWYRAYVSYCTVRFGAARFDVRRLNREARSYRRKVSASSSPSARQSRQKSPQGSARPSRLFDQGDEVFVEHFHAVDLVSNPASC